MNVYRVEHPEDRRGPYQSDTKNPARKRLAVALDSAHYQDDLHPLTHNDAIETFYGPDGDRCAFVSTSSLYDWFEGWLAQLDEAGYRMSTYRVARRHVRQGMHQLVFNINEAERLDTQRLVEVAA